MQSIWTDVLVSGVPIAEKIIRVVIVYFFLLIGLRLAGKRELGQFNPFDLVVLLVLSNTVQNAIIGNDNSVLGGIIGAAALLMLNYIVVRFLFSHPKLDRAAVGKDVILVQDGKVLMRNLRRELITRGELSSAARRQGIPSLDSVDCARLEVGGALTFVLKHPTSDEAWRKDILARLDKMQAKLDALHA